jgi:hypothetical protein
MFDTNNKQFVAKSQEAQEEHIIVGFDFPKTQITPQIGALILYQLGFGVVAIVEVSFDKAQVGDIAIELMHNGFYTRAQV